MFTLRQIKELDTIEVTQGVDFVLNWFTNYEGGIKEYNIFLNEGVIKFKMQEMTQYLYFKVLKENMVEIQCYVIFEYKFHFNCKIHLKVKNTKLNYTLIEPKTTDKGLVDMCIKLFTSTFAYIEHLKSSAETEVKYNKRTVSKSKAPGAVKATNNKRVINLLNNKRIIYKLDLKEEVAKEFKRSYTRHTEAWGVAGHPRHYKSGKVVYVKPFTKGQGKKENKTYKV